ncbi:LacI family DNA-binding transcriptional regulator [Novosphingobium aquimarinum]|uniref:LacI family DNA-binding transcriptional regulator n=1 Tax=Novosphingobium aquimarinum TaxID=2682494 RepID=UPI0012EC336F|nr:LacI family DNA-binding transcriptional regulator [Novosphingobium aquimarinum]
MAVGIRDVALAAGVSPATVSRVLSGKSVDPAMRDAVLKAVETTGYRPNLAARRLRSQHTNTIGLIVADIRNPFFTAVSRTIEDMASRQGLRIILCNTDEDPAKEDAYLDLMEEERVTGVILAPARSARRSKPRDFPTVLIDRTIPGEVFDCVVLDNIAMADALVQHLAHLGHRRIAGLFGAESNTGQERRKGFEDAAARLGIATTSHAVPHAQGEAAQMLHDVLAHADRPDAIVASNGVMLMGVLRELRALGLQVPADIALAGFDNIDWMEFVGEGLTVIEQPVEEIGRTAMTMLTDRIAHPDGPARKVVLQGRLIARGSSGAQAMRKTGTQAKAR